MEHQPQPFLSRRSFLLGTAAGLAVGGSAAWFGSRFYHERLSAPENFTGTPTPNPRAKLGMPGLYPGEVVEVRHDDAVSPDNVIQGETVEQMVDRGMAELTGTELGDIKGGWGKLFEKGDVVGIKVNPVGRKPKPGERRNPNAVGAISSPELLVKVVRCLKELGIPPQDIIVFERYADEFVATGYEELLRSRELEGVRWLASAVRYTGTQVEISGFDHGLNSCSPEMARHVAGYDPDVFVTMGYCSDRHDKHDDRRFRSHLSAIVSRYINKMITLPVLKDHRSAGVTLALKNMSHGMNNNVARSHLSGIAHGVFEGAEVRGPNQCNTFIPRAVAQHRLRQRATLHIMDGLIGVYEGGPGSWNKSWGTWRRKGLFFATDPVAMDHVGWTIIDDKRREKGLPRVEQMGLLYLNETSNPRTALATLAADNPISAAMSSIATSTVLGGRATEVFNARQPEHITLAGQLGLGVFDREKIRYRRVDMG